MTNLFASKSTTAISSLILGVAAALAGSAPHAVAQSPVARVNVPFNFHSGDQQLKAGIYTITVDNQHIMRLSSFKGTGMLMSRPEETLSRNPTSKVIFRRYGNQYFLREVWVAGRNQHQVCAKSKSEKQQEQIALNSTPPTGTEVALLELLH